MSELPYLINISDFDGKTSFKRSLEMICTVIII